MIYIQDGKLILEPRNDESEMPPRQLDLLMGHVCPSCVTVIHGIIPLERPEDGGSPDFVPLFRYASMMGEGGYVNRLLEPADGTLAQHFYEKVHFGNGTLEESSHKVSTYGKSCRYLKAIWEVNPVRRVHRVVRNLKGVSGLEPKLWEPLLTQIGDDRGRAEVFLYLLGQHAGIAADVKGGAPLILLAKHWYAELSRQFIERVMSAITGNSTVSQLEALAGKEDEIEEEEDEEEVFA